MQLVKNIFKLLPNKLQHRIHNAVFENKWVEEKRFQSTTKFLESKFSTMEFKNSSINPLDYEARVFSQNGEDGILLSMIRKIGKIEPFIVEFGVENARQCNARLLAKKENWQYLLMDGTAFKNPYLDTKVVFITAENINELFEDYNVPVNLGVLSVDIDYNTFWVLKAINEKYKPAIILLEYNSSIPVNESKVVPYNPTRTWDGTNFFGASLKAYDNLLINRGYSLICCDSKGINAFYIKNDYKQLFLPHTFEDSFRRPKYGDVINGSHIGHPPSIEKFMDY